MSLEQRVEDFGVQGSWPHGPIQGKHRISDPKGIVG